MSKVTDRQVDGKLAWLCHVEYEGGVESVEAEVAELPREELEQLLALAVVEIMESRADAEREIARYVRRANKAQRRGPTSE
jgi:hypothetical protein